MFTMNKFFDKYSNYNVYMIGHRSASHEVDEERLMKIIKACSELLKKPYLRFMWKDGVTEAVCVVYDGQERLTKLVTLGDIEQMIQERKFHK